MSKSKEDLFDMIGCIGKDNVTGFEGLVVGMLSHLHGCHHYFVQPVDLVDGKMIEPEAFDVQRIRFIKRLVADPKVTRSNIGLGNEVKDTITGVKGVVVGIFTSMYGNSPRLTIQPKECKSGVPAEELRIPEPRVELVNKKRPLNERTKKGGAIGGPTGSSIKPSQYM